MLIQFFSGLFATCFLFLVSLGLVVSIKVLLNWVRKTFIKNDSASQKTTQNTQKPVQKSSNQKRKIHTIQIDPDLADRIYFKKSS
jgi:hypothetical protein